MWLLGGRLGVGNATQDLSPNVFVFLRNLYSFDNIINIRSLFNSLGSLGMDWGPMFILCFVFGFCFKTPYL